MAATVAFAMELADEAAADEAADTESGFVAFRSASQHLSSSGQEPDMHRPAKPRERAVGTCANADDRETRAQYSTRWSTSRSSGNSLNAHRVAA